jgi:hypothetical protein
VGRDVSISITGEMEAICLLDLDRVQDGPPAVKEGFLEAWE